MGEVVGGRLSFSEDSSAKVDVERAVGRRAIALSKIVGQTHGSTPSRLKCSMMMNVGVSECVVILVPSVPMGMCSRESGSG